MAAVTADNHGPLLNVAMWIVLVPMVIATLTKVYIKYDTLRKIQLDDYFGLIAMLSSVAQCVCTSEQITYGLGQNQDTILPNELNSFYIAQYVGNIIYILAIFTTKLSTLYFFICLTREDSAKRRLIYRSIICVGMWILTSVIVVALQCQFPYPWLFRKGQCIDIRVFWTINAAMDALTQVFICLLPIYILSALKLERSKKQLTILLFSPNLLALPLLALRLVYLYETIHSTNYTWDTFNLALVTNLHTSLAIILSCIPFSKSIVDSLTFSPLIITDSTRDTISNRLNNSERGNNSNTGGGSSHFLSCAAARTSTIANVAGGEARELNMYFKFSESQERMISGERA
ncbi:hypothetical protein sscle_10g075430 [Sclerotinia sclerotiorum 1980 UF-70]|uniref:Rhodopsin domain-containing protein n=1 Tax=Sclerotinia sclerotiorum (strain ATCC 18683 / 1980 / Ss-1) TaxID=665079 RepID=A0A1D9QDT1_SCLS1|nr:hypothetical protein sscle_10g075430 [Sclerotinia sclerotiorum 1980 UF-70]